MDRRSHRLGSEQGALENNRFMMFYVVKSGAEVPMLSKLEIKSAYQGTMFAT